MCFCNFKVDVCKRVIHLYRSVVLEVPMEPTTWYYNFTFDLASIKMSICGIICFNTIIIINEMISYMPALVS